MSFFLVCHCIYRYVSETRVRTHQRMLWGGWSNQNDRKIPWMYMISRCVDIFRYTHSMCIPSCFLARLPFDLSLIFLSICLTVCLSIIYRSGCPWSCPPPSPEPSPTPYSSSPHFTGKHTVNSFIHKISSNKKNRKSSLVPSEGCEAKVTNDLDLRIEWNLDCITMGTGYMIIS